MTYFRMLKDERGYVAHFGAEQILLEVECTSSYFEWVEFADGDTNSLHANNCTIVTAKEDGVYVNEYIFDLSILPKMRTELQRLYDNDDYDFTPYVCAW